MLGAMNRHLTFGRESQLPGPRHRSESGGAGSAASVCAFLRAGDASWSSAVATRGLRCWAVEPAVAVATATQRTLCVAAAHAACPAHVAAMARGVDRVRDEGEPQLWPDGVSVPVTLDHIGSRATPLAASPRAGGQAVLVGLMVLAFVVLLVTRVNPIGSGAGSGASGGPSLGVSAGASPANAAPSVPPGSGGPVASVSAGQAGGPSASATVAPSALAPTGSGPASAAPASPARTYTVKSGDTLSAIAGRFHTTVKAIAQANNIVDARTIRPGQILTIP